jgi:hypothetical protein
VEAVVADAGGLAVEAVVDAAVEHAVVVAAEVVAVTANVAVEAVPVVSHVETRV